MSITFAQTPKLAGGSPVTFTNSVTTGNLIVVWLGFASTTPGTVTVADNASPSSNTYFPIGSLNVWPGGGESIQLFYAWNVKGGSALTVTATPGAGGLYQCDIAEFAGVQNTTNPLDSHTEDPGNSNSAGYVSCAAVNTSQTGDLLVAMADWNGSGWQCNGLWSGFDPTGNAIGMTAASAIAAGPGSYPQTGINTGGNEAWNVSTASFFPASSSSLSPFVPDMTPGTCVMWKKT